MKPPGKRVVSTLVCAASALILAFPGAILAQTNFVNTLDPAALNTAIQGGGTVIFTLDGTILLTNTIAITNQVILDGTSHSITISGGGVTQLFNIAPSGQVMLRHLTLANGFLAGRAPYLNVWAPAPGYGGAVNTQGHLAIDGCTFSNNSVTSVELSSLPGEPAYGGAIYNLGWLAISNTLFASNTAVGGANGLLHSTVSGSGYGGAICQAGGALTLNNVVFTNNSVRGATQSDSYEGGNCGNGYGGAICASGGVVTANSIQVINNTAVGPSYAQPSVTSGPLTGGSGLGGGLYSTGCSLAISNSSFSGNSTSSGLGYYAGCGQSQGGGIFNAASAFFVNCTFASNSALGVWYDGETYPVQVGDGMGGAIYNTGGAQIISSILSGNLAAGGTGFLYADGARYIHSNGWGGAIFNSGFVQLTSSVLSNNSTSGTSNFGQAIYSSGVIQSDAASVLWPNVAAAPPLTCQWQVNGNYIAGATNSAFDLGDVQFGNAGTYYLAVSNATSLFTNLEEIVNSPPPPVTILGVTPNIGPLAGGTSVTISGAGFTNGATVFFGNAAATSVAVINATCITAVTPPGTALGVCNVGVNNTNFQSGLLANGFTYAAPISIFIAQQSDVSGSGGAGTFLLTVGGCGAASFNFVLECSTNLVNWQPLQTNSLPFIFTDTNAANNPVRFYRGALR